MTEQELETLISALANELGIDYREALDFKNMCNGSLFCVFLHLLTLKTKIDKDKKQQLFDAMKRVLESEKQVKLSQKIIEELIETYFKSVSEKKSLNELVRESQNYFGGNQSKTEHRSRKP